MIKLLILLCSLPLLANVPLKISEDSLQVLATKGAPQIDQIEAAFINAQVKEGEEVQKFAPELFGKGSYAETNERAIIQFQPIFSPVKQAQVGVRQNTKHGVEASAYLSTDQRSARSAFIGKLQNVTTTTLAFTVQMDLWKDVFGRLSKRKLENVELEKKRADIEKTIQMKTFQLSLRRVYWSLVANNEALKISEGLLKTADRQLNETRMRFKNSVAEADEVARYEAQAASRQGTILYLKFQRETLLKQLKNLLPELSGDQIEIDGYDIPRTINEVMACTATIAQQSKVPLHFTQYDEVIELLRRIKSNKAFVNSHYADSDLKLFGTVKSTGVGSESKKTGLIEGSYQDSIDDQTKKNRTGYEVGLSFNVPLGEAKASTQKVKELYDEKRLLASINATDAQVTNTHEQLVRSIDYLSDIIRAQKTNSEQLEKRLRLMRRKYEQARVSVNDLVFDQDALLNSELTTIETQLQIINTIFDYLVIFTDTPCAFNRI